MPRCSCISRGRGPDLGEQRPGAVVSKHVAAQCEAWVRTTLAKMRPPLHVCSERPAIELHMLDSETVMNHNGRSFAVHVIENDSSGLWINVQARRRPLVMSGFEDSSGAGFARPPKMDMP